MNKTIIKAKNISLSYNKKENILSDVSLSINKGDLVFITGVSGSGKSTLLKSFYANLKPTKGSLIVNGFETLNINKHKINELRKTLGLVFQDYKLINEWNIEKNISLPMIIAGFGKDVINAQVTKLLNHVKLSHRKDRYPFELSGGEQQRVGVARALAHNPDIILADEPTGNLDDYSTSLVMDLFFKINSLGKTVVIVTHKMPTNIVLNYKHFHIDKGLVYEYT